MLLTHRKLLQSKAIAIENDLRATLRNLGLKVAWWGRLSLRRDAGPQVFGGIVCQERAGVAQRFSSRCPIEFGEIYDSACAGESVGQRSIYASR